MAGNSLNWLRTKAQSVLEKTALLRQHVCVCVCVRCAKKRSWVTVTQTNLTREKLFFFSSPGERNRQYGAHFNKIPLVPLLPLQRLLTVPALWAEYQQQFSP